MPPGAMMCQKLGERAQERERERAQDREREVAKLITVFWGSGMFSSGPQCEEVVAALRSGREGASARRKMPRKR